MSARRVGAPSTETFEAMWRRTVASHPERVFLRFVGRAGDISEWTYGSFDRIVEGAANRFADDGVTAGRSVHLALTNSPAFVAAWLGAVRLGAWIVPSDPQATTRELQEQAARTAPAVALCATARAATYLAVDAGSLPPVVIDVDESDAVLPWLRPAAPVQRQRPAPTDRAAVMFTSGTTGRPKGVEITQANYAFAGAVMAAACDLTADDRQLVVLPLFHANAQYYSFAAAIAVGASVALMPTFSASRFLDQAASHRATCASLFAGPIRMILARAEPRPAAAEPLALRHCWFAQNLTPEHYETFASWIGCRPRQLYGMTETIPAVLTDTSDDPRCDSLGSVTDGCLVDVHDGEIVVGGEPGITLFAGYLDDPGATAASFRDGWFLTSDRARRDADGRYAFVGRRSDVLKVAGENVSVVEIEQVIARCPGVADVAVVGEPDAVRDEVPVAFVVAADSGAGGDALRDAVAAWCVTHLARAKRPREINLVEELPRTSVGKVKKYQLRASVSGTTEGSRR